jgi:hypothetical protein
VLLFELRIGCGTRERGDLKSPGISSPPPKIYAQMIAVPWDLGKKLLKLTFGIPIEFERTVLSGIVNSLDFIET